MYYLRQVLFETQTLFETKLYSKETLSEERIWFSTKRFEGILETLTDGQKKLDHTCILMEEMLYLEKSEHGYNI